MSSRVPRPSILLQHIHGTIPALTRLYEEAAGSAKKGTTLLSSSRDKVSSPASGTLSSSASLADSTKTFPQDPQNEAEGNHVLSFFCRELGMGQQALALWRKRSAEAAHRYWGATSSDAGETKTTAATLADIELPQPIAVRQPAIADPASHGSHETTATAAVPSPPLYLQPRRQDVVFVRSAMARLRLVVSPFITLSPPPSPLAPRDPPAQHGDAATPKCEFVLPPPPHRTAITVAASTPRPMSEAASSRFYATRSIPAGMFVLSLPTEAVLMAQPPPSADPILSFFLHLDDLIGQLVAAEEEGPAHPHYEYVQYLKDSVSPTRNLPFLSRKAMEKLVGPHPEPVERASPAGEQGTSASAALRSSPDSRSELPQGDHTSPAWTLWRFFHEDMAKSPLSPYLRDRLDTDAYVWWASTVLARRAGAAMLIPVTDKLNHHPLPNCYYTMSNEASLCGLDVLDNLLAGVPLDLLYQPYVHVFTIRDVAPGEELTLCYASPDQGHYQPASRYLPAPPPRRDASTTTAPTPSPEALQDAYLSLFPASSLPSGLSLHDADAMAERLQSAAHPSTRQEVHTVEGRARWQLQWGFVPPCDAVFSGKDLEEVAGIVAERRVDTRSVLFPPSSASCPGEKETQS